MTSDVLPWFENAVGQYAGITQETYDNYYSRVTAATVSCTEDEYNELLTIVQNGIMKPETGYYRMRSAGNRTGETYIGYGTTGLSGKNSPCLVTVGVADKFTDASTVIYLQQQSDGTYYVSTQGLNVQNETAANQPFLVNANAPHAFYFNATSPGKFSMSNDGTNDGLFCESNWAGEAGFVANGVTRWRVSSLASNWTIEKAEVFTINLNAVDGKSYATTYLPFDITLGSEATAYVLQVNSSGDEAKMVSIGQNVPAETPVLIVSDSEAASVSATITSGLEPVSASNDLWGNMITGEQSNVLVLNAVDGKVGFYPLASGGSVASNRAFLDGSSAIRTLVFDDEVTGISSAAVNGSASAPIYDLQGRRVHQTGHGIYIVGGKKVLF